MRRLIITLAIISTCLGAFGQGKIYIENDNNHLIVDCCVPISQAGGWDNLTMQLWAGTSAGTLTLQTTIVGAAIGNVAFPDGRIAKRMFTLIGVLPGKTYLQLRFLDTATMGNVLNGDTPVFTVTAGSFAPNSIVDSSAPSLSTWPAGPLEVRWWCGSCVPPEFTANPTNASVSVGGDVTLSAYATSDLNTEGEPYPVSYQWRKGGSPIPQATNSFLTLTNVTLAAAGNYDVVASNLNGSTASSMATLTVFTPVIAATLGSPNYSTNNQFQFTVTGTAGTNYIVQVSTNLATTDWRPVITNASPFTFIDTNANSFPQRFYRVYSP